MEQMQSSVPQQPKKNNTTLIVIIIAVVVVLAGAAWWYQMWMAQQTANKVVNTIAGAVGGKVNVNVQQQDQKITVTGQDGSKTEIGVGSKIPDNFPSDVPVYQPASVAAATNGVAGIGMSVQLSTDDSAEKVIAYYVAQMATQGWSTLITVDTAQGKQYTYTKNGRTVAVSAGKDATTGKTQINLTVISVAK